MNANEHYIELKNLFGDIMGRWTYKVPDTSDPSEQLYRFEITVNNYNRRDGVSRLLNSTIVNPLRIALRKYSSETEYTEVYMSTSLTELRQRIILTNIPTADLGLSTGQIWRDGNLIRIKT
jgi:hypothetical protein